MPPGTTFPQRDLKIAAALSAVAILAGAFWMRPDSVGLLHDDGVYVTTAKALADGRGYRVISLPNEPLQTKYPFLYPVLLATVWKIWPSFPANVVALKGISLLCAGAAIGLAYLYVIRFRYASRRAAVWAGALCATSSFFLMFAVSAISDAFFAMLAVLAVWKLESVVEQDDSRPGTALLAGAVAGLPFLARSIGIVFVAPALMTWVRRRSRSIWVVAGIAVVWLPWILWVLLVLRDSPSDPLTKYQTDYLGLSGTLEKGPNFSFWWSEIGRTYLPTMLWRNVAFTLMGATLPLGGLSALASALDPRFLIFLTVAGLITWWSIARGLLSGRILHSFLIAYGLTLCIWPWRSTRFLMPILPLLAPMLVMAVSRAMSAILAPAHLSVVAPFVLAATFALNCSTIVGWGTISRLANAGSDQETERLWPAISVALDWLRTNTDKSDVVAAPDDPLVYLYTGRKSIRPFVYEPATLFYGAQLGATGTVADFVGHVTPYRPTYLLYYPSLLGAEDFATLITSVRERYPWWLVAVFRTPDPRVLVFRFDWNHSPDQRNPHQ